MSIKMKPDDPSYWMLFDGVEAVPVIYHSDCYICSDPEFAQMGLPLCRKCPFCGGHVPADDCVCNNCHLNEEMAYRISEDEASLVRWLEEHGHDEEPARL